MNTTMAAETLRQRLPPASAQIRDTKSAGTPKQSTEPTQHPGGEIKHGPWQQALRMFMFAVYFNGSILASVLNKLLSLQISDSIPVSPLPSSLAHHCTFTTRTSFMHGWP
jgi:hypothetical protein